MPVVEAWFFIVASLLVVSGGAKLADPKPTQGALRAAHLPSGRLAVQTLATAEIAGGISALLGIALGIGAVAALYLSFGAFVAWALLRRLPLQSCGCLGKADTPPSLAHLLVNLAAAAATLAMLGRPGLPTVLTRQPLLGLPYLAFLAIGVFLLVLIIAELPRSHR